MAAVSAPAILGARVAIRGKAVRGPAKKQSVAITRCAPKAEAKSAGEKAAAAAAAVTLAASPANASELGQDLYPIFDKIDKAADKVESAFSVVSGAADKVGAVVGKVTPIVQPIAERLVKAAVPVGKAVGSAAVKAAAPIAEAGLSTAATAASSAVASAGVALKEQGIDVAPAVTVVKTGAGVVVDTVSAAVPAVSGAVDFVAKATPTDAVELGLGAGAVYFLVPAVIGLAGSAVRGYAGEIRPVEAYDAVLSSGKIVIVDIRRENEIERAGIPEFPRRAASRYVAVPRERLTGSFKDISDVEASLTALKIANLRGVKKGSTILMLDANGGDAPKVAKALAAQAGLTVQVVQGGFGGWAKAGLAINKEGTQVRGILG